MRIKNTTPPMVTLYGDKSCLCHYFPVKALGLNVDANDFLDMSGDLFLEEVWL